MEALTNLSNSIGDSNATHILTGKTALVTGGGRGISATISKTLAKRGANVVVNYFKYEGSANEIVSQIKTIKESDPLVGNTIGVKADVTDAECVSSMMDKIKGSFDHVDIMVNNAMTGLYFLKPFLELKWEDFYERFYDEIKAAYEITRATLPSIIKHNYGKIVYIATGSAKYPNPPGAIAFGTAKAGLVAFAKYIAQEYGRNGMSKYCVTRIGTTRFIINDRKGK